MFKIWEYRPWKIVVAYLIGILVVILNTPLKDSAKELLSNPPIVLSILGIVAFSVAVYFLSKEKGNSKNME